MILGVPKTCQASPFSAFLAVLASLSFSNLQICKGGVGFKSPSPHQVTCFRIGDTAAMNGPIAAPGESAIRREDPALFVTPSRLFPYAGAGWGASLWFSTTQISNCLAAR